MFENAREIMATLSLAAASCAVGSIAVRNSAESSPENSRTYLEPVYIKEQEGHKDMEVSIDANFNRSRKLGRSGLVTSTKTFPVKRVYGRKGQLGNRIRGDVTTFIHR